ncbi:Ger(x)C family spore germination protein [Fodinisporobacter ferrooxydans]|uniref:Ger(X)C family spore germination protein n=1 Tax=Fodinisporobacter ferrooxydans TaxID=2901836 RepID=A0ABY4CQ49_9BACL|nr:Ger(x)C family spore germination protein [Alicyclobacillaceae bacterium MYW30-H2]
MKYLACIVVLLFVMLPISGCWDQRELNEISLVTGLAVDQGRQKKYNVSFEAVNAAELTKKGGGGNAASLVFSQEGQSVSSLLEKMNIGISRHLVYSHVRTVVISEMVAKEGLADILEFMERNREIRDDFNLVIARNVKAADILRMSYPLQKVSTLKLHQQLSQAFHDWGSDPDVRMRDMIAAFTSKGREPVAATVTIAGNVKKGNSLDNTKKITPDALVELCNLSVFRKDKLIGYLPLIDTRNYLWLQNKPFNTSIVLHCEKKQTVTIRIREFTTDIHTNFNHQTPTIHVQMDTYGVVDSMQCKKLDLTKLNTYETLETMMSEHIRRELLHTIHKVQNKYKVDIFGFGDIAHRQHPKEFNSIAKWDEAFSKANIQVSVRANIKRSGIYTKGFLNEMK